MRSNPAIQHPAQPPPSLRTQYQPAGRRTPRSGGPAWNEGLAAGQQSNPAPLSNDALGHISFDQSGSPRLRPRDDTLPRHCERSTSPQGAGCHTVAVPSGTRDWPQANKTIQPPLSNDALGHISFDPLDRRGLRPRDDIPTLNAPHPSQSPKSRARSPTNPASTSQTKSASNTDPNTHTRTPSELSAA